MAAFFGSPSFTTHPLTKFSSSQAPPPPQQQPPQPLPVIPPVQPVTIKPPQKPNQTPESTDWIASTLTRRFGLGAGLAWAGFLAAGVVSEQIKTRLEVTQQAANTRDVEREEEVVLPNGIRYYDLRVGGGDYSRTRDLVVIDLEGRVKGGGDDNSKAFVDTFKDKRPLALVMGSRPYTKGMCEGVEYILRSMRAGGKRRVIVPPGLGFGDKGADLGSGFQIPPDASLEFVVQVDKVSIAPA
ncbi:hypothetical protein QJS10_CPB19g01825 [Acorus calamus]|uniref:peptidylprolyl isomerase n=1 Tax=Acorus calamus TaxID=4465 RepID=A0AAV9CDT8_ACOCL|nr:hypothetical protein QJS10_CPB19g01825 [Acorus calamus]